MTWRKIGFHDAARAQHTIPDTIGSDTAAMIACRHRENFISILWFFLLLYFLHSLTLYLDFVYSIQIHKFIFCSQFILACTRTRVNSIFSLCSSIHGRNHIVLNENVFMDIYICNTKRARQIIEEYDCSFRYRSK